MPFPLFRVNSAFSPVFLPHISLLDAGKNYIIEEELKLDMELPQLNMHHTSFEQFLLDRIALQFGSISEFV